ncbi:MAG: type II secretion system F family protein, partial [Prochlorothrix sp.]
MATFVVQVRDAQGALKKQKVEGESAREVRASLREQGLTIQEIKKAQSFQEILDGLGKIDIGEYTASVTVKDKAIFSRQMAVMVNAGVPIVRSLGVLAGQCPNPKLKKALTVISDDVQQGNNMSESMRKFPESFDNLYIAMV